MLGLSALGRLALGQLADGSGAGVPAPIGSAIGGGTFSRGRWRELKEAERRAREAAERARERVEAQAREAVRQRTAAERAAIEAGRRIEDEAASDRRRQARLDHDAEAPGVAQRITDGFAAADRRTDTARASAGEYLAAQDEEEAVMQLLLLS